MEAGGTVESASDGNGGYVVFLRGSGNSYVNEPLRISPEDADSKVSWEDNIMSLLDYSNPGDTITTIACFANLFKDCTSLESAPALPATELAQVCYASMFDNCTSLKSAPALPATELVNNCYASMFEGCTSLATVPSLEHVKTTAYCCFDSMFYGCKSLYFSSKEDETYKNSIGTLVKQGDALGIGRDMFVETAGFYKGSVDTGVEYWTSNPAVYPQSN